MAKRAEWARETTTWHKDGQLYTVQVCIDDPDKPEDGRLWNCTYWLIGFGEAERYDIVGNNAVQALSLALQQIKLKLVLMMDEGYTHCEIDENETIVKVFNRRETMKNLNAVYGLGTLLDKTHIEEWCLEAIERLKAGIGTEKEQNEDLDFLRKNLSDPKISDYIFHSKLDLTPEEILAKALAYRPIAL
jgi:hypothetical protein